MNEDVGAAVLAARTARNMSRREFAELTGLTQTQIGNIEKGRKLKPGEWEHLAPHLNGSAGSAPEASTLDASPAAGGTPGQTAWDHAQDMGEFKMAPPSGEPVSTDLPLVLLTEDEDGDLTVESHTGFAAEPASPDPNHWSSWDGADPKAGEVCPSEDAVATIEGFTETDQPLRPEPVSVQFLGRLVSNSEVQTFKRCKRKWWLAWYRHLELARERPTGARSIGTWVHRALARYYVPEGTVREDPREALEMVLTDINTVVTEAALDLQKNADDQGLSAEALVQQFKKDAELARAMVDGYVQWISETGADESLQVISPEQVIAMPMIDIENGEPIMTFVPDELGASQPVQIIGKLDVRALRMIDNLKLFVDHKTVGSFDRATKMIGQNEQMLQYLFLEQNQDDNIRTGGALYNMLRKVKRTANAKPPFYQRVEVRHSPIEVESFHRHLTGTVLEILDTEMKLSMLGDHQRIVPPRPADDCSWSCDFVAVCPMFDDGSRAEDMLAQLYRTSRHLSYYDDVNEYDTALDES